MSASLAWTHLTPGGQIPLGMVTGASIVGVDKERKFTCYFVLFVLQQFLVQRRRNFDNLLSIRIHSGFVMVGGLCGKRENTVRILTKKLPG